MLQIVATPRVMFACLPQSLSLRWSSVCNNCKTVFITILPQDYMYISPVASILAGKTQFGNLQDFAFLPQFSSVPHKLYCLLRGHCVLWCRLAPLSSSVTASVFDLVLVASLWLWWFFIQTSTPTPSMHPKTITKHGRFRDAKQPTPDQNSGWIKGYLCLWNLNLGRVEGIG